MNASFPHISQFMVSSSEESNNMAKLSILSNISNYFSFNTDCYNQASTMARGGMTCAHMSSHATNNISFLHNIMLIQMVKRGGKQVITVEIFKATYDIMKANAEKKRWNTKDYINTVLLESIERNEFLQSYAPSLS